MCLVSNNLCNDRCELQCWVRRELEAEVFLEEDEEDGSILDSTLVHLEKIVADATKYLGVKPQKKKLLVEDISLEGICRGLVSSALTN